MLIMKNFSKTKSNAFKIIVVGDKRVGKSNIVTRFTQNEFSLESSSSPMINIYTDMKIKPDRSSELRRSCSKEEEEVKFHIWDTECQEEPHSLHLYFKGCHGIMLVYDVTKQHSFESLSGWMDTIKEHLPETNIVLVGNKSDLHNLKTVCAEDGQAFADSHGIPFYEASALDCSNINEAFEDLLQSVIDSRESHDGASTSA
ncbi:unnamed protein product [Moneuplotes crassus]|uniref:Uncharacterized protein n=1 Tax=Euplotes crassus TaxID=5936 RepID=A0AAD1UGG6_EUPCR|nr:unnamed protein product [Moneuplotes crassus]